MKKERKKKMVIRSSEMARLLFIHLSEQSPIFSKIDEKFNNIIKMRKTQYYRHKLYIYNFI